MHMRQLAMPAHHDEGQQAQHTPDEPDELAHMKNPWRLRTEQQEELGQKAWLRQACTMAMERQPMMKGLLAIMTITQIFKKASPLFVGLLFAIICKQSEVSGRRTAPSRMYCTSCTMTYTRQASARPDESVSQQLTE